MKNKEEGRITRKIASLWKIHQEHQVIFKLVMRRDISGDLRRVCSQGYMISLLCNKEIMLLYRTIKCPFNDKEPRNEEELAGRKKWLEVCEREALPGYLKRKQVFLLKRYLSLAKYLRDDDEQMRLLKDHIYVIKRLVVRFASLQQVPFAVASRHYPLLQWNSADPE